MPKLREGGGSFDSARSGESLSIQELRQFFALLDHISFDRDPDGFAARVHEVMANADPDAEHAFVFIHGFNVPFRNAAFRTAQLKYDMQIEGPVFFFCCGAPSILSVHEIVFSEPDYRGRHLTKG